MTELCKEIIKILDANNLSYTLMGAKNDDTWMVYPSHKNRLWEIDTNLSGIFNHQGETSILIKTNPNQWQELDNSFKYGYVDYIEYYITTIEDFNQHLDELLFINNAYNILHPTYKNT